MKISVVIPTYNSASFIKYTLDSVLAQSYAADEILVLDDGSTDNTVSILNTYKPWITVYEQHNKGVASARNVLCELTQGELIAFVDHDDIWHPNYLEAQRTLFANYPMAVAFFTGHVNFSGYGSYSWNNSAPTNLDNVELFRPLSFFQQYNTNTGNFASMSYCCIPKRLLTEIGSEPFCVWVSGADDFFFFNLLPLLGPVVCARTPLVAYRITGTAQSENQVKSLALAVRAFELLEGRYRAAHDRTLLSRFDMAFASKRRHYAKTLMGAGRVSEARTQLWVTLKNTNRPISLAKTLSLLVLTCMPSALQPNWLPTYRGSNCCNSVTKENKRYQARPSDK